MVKKTLQAMAVAGGLALAIGANATGALAQQDDSGMTGPTGTVSAEDLADAILAEVLAGIALPTSGGLEIDVPTVAPEGDMNVGGGNVNVGGNSGGGITVGGGSGGGTTVGGGTGGDVSMGGGGMSAPAPEAPAAPMSGGGGSTDSGY